MEIQSYLSQRYPGHESFIENIIIPIFGEDNYETAWDVELLDTVELQNQAARTGIRSILRCGTINLDLTPIEVFDITVADRIMMDKNRVGVQAIIRRVMDTYSGAFMLIHYDNDVKWDWRFTFCQLKDKSEFTDSKRYTFLLGPNQSCRTAAQNFQKLADLHEDITIKDIVAAFDVEALSKAFFDGYKLHYERFVEYITGKRFVKNGGRFEETVTHSPHRVYYPAFRRDDKAVRDYTKLLLARIVFLHFLQKKGWLGVPANGKWGDGDEQFMKHLFERASAAQKDDFLESVLEPLFFDALNGDRAGNKDLFDTKVLGVVRIPYLNGGLFSKDSLDDIVIKYPRDYFGDFLEFLYQYNFTIDENDPNEAQVGIDPEMLGKIFENLLEDNKDKGAFYTPKEIVQYMCQESLVAYLATKTGYDEDKLRSFVKNPDVFVDKFTEVEKDALLGAILNVKICDPAIGSGAFPIGLLNELVRCKEAIFGEEKERAEIKKEIIRDNIYGVDIEKGAVDIARLRFWLSLIVDEEEPCPLPNLDYKIMQGNSLLEWYNGVDLSHLTDMAAYDDMFGGGRAEALKESLAKLLKDYFGESNHNKKVTLKASVSETIKSILEIAGVDIPSDIDVAENSQFFLWHTWFNEVFAGGGFDIIIGNPPYVSVRTKNFDVSLKPVYKQRFELAVGQYDLYVLFIEQAYHMLNQQGTLSFIVPTRLLSNENFMPARLFLKEKLFINRYVNAEAPFETASVEANIMVCSKGTQKDKVASYRYNNDTKSFDLLVLASRGIIDSMPFSIFPFVYSDDIIALFSKIQTSTTVPLGSYLEITRGLECGYKDTCVTSTQTRYPLIKAEQIKRFFIEGESGLYCRPDFSNPSKFKTKSVFERLPKLVTKFCSGDIQFALDTVGYYNTNSVYNCAVKDMNTAYLLMGVLNSPITSFWFNIAYMNIDGLFPHIQKNQLESIPVPLLDAETTKRIINLVKSYLEHPDTGILNMIDDIVYNYYHLTEIERRIVAKSINA